MHGNNKSNNVSLYILAEHLNQTSKNHYVMPTERIGSKHYTIQIWDTKKSVKNTEIVLCKINNDFF